MAKDRRILADAVTLEMRQFGTSHRVAAFQDAHSIGRHIATVHRSNRVSGQCEVSLPKVDLSLAVRPAPVGGDHDTVDEVSVYDISL
jgi:hypothetical protein